MQTNFGTKMEMKQEDRAAHDFDTFRPKFASTISKLSNKALKRVMTTLVEFPLNGEVKLSDDMERLAVSLGLHLIECRNIIMYQLYLEKQKQENTEQKGEVTNG